MNEMSAFRPASRSEAKPLIGLYAESGCGKTWSALMMARGFVGPNGKIGMIETEGGRGEANVGREPVGQYLVRPIRGEFSPQEYGRAISEAETAKLDALIIDSASHEWEGAGGVLSMAASNQAAGKKGVLVWQQPKIDHQRHFMLRLMQTPIPLVIVCMRAKYPMEQVKGADWKRSERLEPKQSEDILFEMFVHGWIDPQHRFHATRYTLPELADVIIDGEPISLATGQRLTAWAKGTPVSPATQESSEKNPAPTALETQASTAQVGAGMTWDEYVERWDAMLDEATDADQLGQLWNSQVHKEIRLKIEWPEDATLKNLMGRVSMKIKALKVAA